MLTAMKIYAALALLFPGLLGIRRLASQNRRDEAKREYDWHMSPIYLHEPLGVIRSKDLI